MLLSLYNITKRYNKRETSKTRFIHSFRYVEMKFISIVIVYLMKAMKIASTLYGRKNRDFDMIS